MRAVLLNTGADGAKEENEMNKRFLAAILACLLLTGCGARRTEPLSEEPAAGGEHIAYVPLDDRPDNV